MSDKPFSVCLKQRGLVLRATLDCHECPIPCFCIAMQLHKCWPVLQFEHHLLSKLDLIMFQECQSCDLKCFGCHFTA